MDTVQVAISSTKTHKNSLSDAKRKTPPNLNEMMAFFLFNIANRMSSKFIMSLEIHEQSESDLVPIYRRINYRT